MESLRGDELRSAQAFRKNRRELSALFGFLTTPQVILFWILLLIADMVIGILFSGSNSQNWAEMLTLVVTVVFAADVSTRCSLHRISTGNCLSFWHDRMNLVDGLVAAVTILTSIVGVIQESNSLSSQAGIVKSFRALRVFRILRVLRFARFLRICRVYVLCQEQQEYLMYKLDQKLRKPLWNFVSLFILGGMFIAICSEFLYLWQPVPRSTFRKMNENGDDVISVTFPFV
jgi:hypothetical protein